MITLVSSYFSPWANILHPSVAETKSHFLQAKYHNYLDGFMRLFWGRWGLNFFFFFFQFQWKFQANTFKGQWNIFFVKSIIASLLKTKVQLLHHIYLWPPILWHSTAMNKEKIEAMATKFSIKFAIQVAFWEMSTNFLFTATGNQEVGWRLKNNSV